MMTTGTRATLALVSIAFAFALFACTAFDIFPTHVQHCLVGLQCGSDGVANSVMVNDCLIGKGAGGD